MIGAPRRDLLVGALLAGALLATYAVVVAVPYGFSDDYLHLELARRGKVWDLQTVATGRPLYLFFLAGGFSATSAIPDLRWLRLLSILGAALVAWQLYRAAARAGFGWWQAAVLGALVCTTPPFQCLAAWAITFPYTLSAALSLAAYRVCQLAIDRRRRLLLVAATALVVASGTTYQVTAMFFVVPLAIDLLGEERERRDPLRRALVAGGVLVAGLALCFSAFLIGRRLFPGEVPPGRGAVSLDVAAKLDWFLHQPLADALRLWSIRPEGLLAPALAAVLATGLLLYFRGGLPGRLARLALAAALLPVAYAPNLVAAESWSAYRTQAALTSLLVVYAFLAAHGFLRLLPAAARRPASLLILLLGLELAALSARRNVRVCFAEPQRIELMLMADLLRAIDLATVRRVHVIGCPWSDLDAPVRYDELGLPSTAQPLIGEAMAWLLARDLLGRPPAFAITGSVGTMPADLAPGDGVVDMRLLRERR